MLREINLKVSHGLKGVIFLFAFLLLFSTPQGEITTHIEESKDIQIVRTAIHAPAGLDDVNITTDTVWNTDMNLTRGIEIDEDATLFINNSYVRLNQANYSSCSIIVKNGGTLIIKNGSTLNTYNDSIVMYSIDYQGGSNGNITDSTINRCYNIEVSSCQITPFSAEIVIANNIFYDWGSLSGGMIDAQHADKINITGNDFCNPDHDSEYTIRLIDAQNSTIKDNVFHDYSIQNGTNSNQDRNIVFLSPDSINGPIHSVITGNTFSNLGISGHEGLHCIWVGPPNVEISNNVFENIMGYGIKGGVSNCTIQSNAFSNMTGNCPIYNLASYPSGAIFLYGSVAYNTIQNNYIEDTVGPGIWVRESSFNTISENAISSCDEAGIRLSEDGDAAVNNTIQGNILVGNARGVEILYLGANTTTYENMFLMNNVAATDQSNDNNAWNNDTWGNLWYGRYGGSDGDSNWIGDTSFVLDANITDYYPAFRIGDLPPGSGDMTVTKPTGYWQYDITIPGDVTLTGIASALIFLDLNVSMSQGSTTYFDVPQYAGAYFGGADVSLSAMLRIRSYGEFNIHNSALSGSSLWINMYGGSTEFINSNVTGGGGTYFENCIDFRVENSVFEGSVSLESGSENGVFDHCNLTQLSNSPSCDNFDFEFCEFSDNVSIGLSQYYNFYQCTFGSGYIYLNQADYISFDSSHFSGFRPVIGHSHMIEVYYSDWFNFSYNTIENTTAGVYFTGICSYAEISYNDFTMVSGIPVDFSNGGTGNYFTVSHNSFEGSGISIEGEGRDAIITWNNIICTSYGIHVDSNNLDITIENNVIQCSGTWGIYVIDATGGSIAHNVISGGVHSGMELTDFDNGMIQNNTVIETTFTAIYLSGSSGGSDMYDNYVFHNDGWGLYVDGNLDTVWFNSFWDNDDGNIYIGSSGTVNALDNGTYGNFWGPSGPNGQDYYSGPDSATDWIGGGTYDVYYSTTLKAQDNYPLLINKRIYLTYSTTVSGVPLYVAEELIVLAEQFTVQQGIRVTNGYSITFVGTQVDFYNTTAVPQYIEVQTGGTLKMIGGAKFTSNNTETYGLALQSGSIFYVDNATFEYPGYGTANTGLYINVSTVTLLNMDVTLAGTGIILDGVTGVYLENVTVWSCLNGMLITDSTLVHVYNSYMTTISGTGIIVDTNSYDTTIEYSIFSDCTSCVNLTGSSDNNIIRFCEFYLSDVAIHVDALVTNSMVYFNSFATSNDFYIEDAGSTTAYDNGTYGNWYGDYSGEDNDGDLIGDTSYDNPINSDIVDTKPLVIWGSYPTSSGWDITQSTVVLHTNYTLNGDLTVHEGQTLIIRGGTIWFDCSAQAEFELGVYGHLEMQNNALRAINLNYMFLFNTYDVGSLYVRNLYASGMYQFRIMTNSTDVQSVVLEDTEDGFEIAGTSSDHLNSITLSDIVVNRSASYGIYVVYTDTLNLFMVTFEDVTQGIRTEYVTDVTIDTFEGTSCSYGLYIRETTNLSVSNGVINSTNAGIHIQNPFYGSLSISNVDIVDTGNYGIYMLMFGDYGIDVSLYNVNVTGASLYSIFIQRAATCTIRECNTVMSDSETGIYLSTINWVEVENTTISHSENGFYLIQLGGIFTGCEFWNVSNGIYTEYTLTGFNITVVDSEFQSCNRGLYLVDFGNNMINITNNQFWYGGRAAYQVETDFFVFAYNQVWYQDYGIFATAGTGYLIHHNVYQTVESPIVMNTGGTGGNISFETVVHASTAFKVQFVDDLTIQNCSISYADYAVHLTSCQNITIYGVEMEILNSAGVSIVNTEGVNMTYCSIGGSMYAITYTVASETEADHNIDTTNLYEGKPIYYFFNETSLQYSYLNTSHLTMFYCDDVIIVNSTVDTDGVYLGFSTGCTLVNSSLGRAIQLNSVEDILFIGNEFSIFGTTIARYNFATNVTFTRNAFLDFYTFSQSGYNLNGSDQIGNYWHDYTGDDANYDGIGDTPHVTNTMNDYHPLVVSPRSVLMIIDFISPANESVVSGTVVIRVNVTLILGIYYPESGSAITNIRVGSSIYPGGSTGIIEVDVILSEGDNLIEVYSTIDLTYQFEESITLTYDTTNPLIDLDIEDRYATSSSNPQISSTLADTNLLAWAAVVVNGTTQNNDTLSTSSTTWTFDITFDTDGMYTVTYLVSDEAGNIANLTITMYRDSTDPVVTDPSDISYQEGSTGNTVTIEASDLTPYQYNVSLDGFLIDTVAWDGSDAIINVDGLSVGEHELEVLFQDRVGHTSTVFVTITVTQSTTSTTTTTTTTTTETTTTTTTTSSPPPTGLDPMVMILVIGGIGGAILVVIVIFVLKKRPST